MSTLRKKAGKKVMTKKTKSKGDGFVTDVTIHDFANTSKLHARLKKGTTNVCSEVKQEIITQKEPEDTWDKLDDEFCPQISKTKKKTDNDALCPSQRHGRKSKSEEIVEEEKGIDYPLDIWFIISEYISPEAVGKLARICKSSYHVTTTGKFWFHLYKSFVPGLPERLQPQCMVRQHGLRACVIRTLHYTYFSLKKKVDDLNCMEQEEPRCLLRRRCCLMWHKVGKVRWYFFFKLKEISKTRNASLTQINRVNGKKTDFLEMIEDVAVNPEEGCKVLRVTCLKYSMLPPVIGLILHTVSMNKYRLHLGFGTSDVPNALTNLVILNDVINYQILDWWHPCYPHQDAVSAIELPQNDSWD